MVCLSALKIVPKVLNDFPVLYSLIIDSASKSLKGLQPS